MENNYSEIVSNYFRRKGLENFLVDNQKYLYRIAFSYVKNKDDTLEIVQNTIYKSIASVGSLKNIECIKAWVTRILINECFDFLKKVNKIIFVDEVLDDFNVDNFTLNKIMLRQALDKLSTNLKTIVVLRFFEDFKIKDIAKIMDMNENTVKTNLYKALKILKLDLKEDLNDV